MRGWVVLGFLLSAVAPGGCLTLNVSPKGEISSLAAARDAVRKLKVDGKLAEPVRVIVADGVYPLTEPVVFAPDDSGTAATPITYEAAPGAHPVFTAGRALGGWTAGADGLWTASVPPGADFEQLYVNGRHALRARTPSKFYHYMVRGAPIGSDPNRCFTAEPADLAPLAALTPDQLKQVVVVAFFSWESARLPIASVDFKTGVVTCAGKSAWPLCGFYGNSVRQRYQLENVPYALGEPGAWYLDRAAGRVSYRPRAGEQLATAQVYLPGGDRLLRIAGEPKLGLTVEHLTFRGLAFKHAGYRLPATGHSDGQAEVTLDAAVMLDGAQAVNFDRCEFANYGAWALWFRFGCRGSSVTRSYLHDLGAGGIKVGTGWAVDNPNDAQITRALKLDNNIIHGATWIHHGGHGIWIGHSPDNQVTHNDIADLNYTAISAGWRWGYAASVCKRNTIDFNRLHHLGWGVLSDMGGVYTLGPSEGTTVSNNVISDVNDYGYYGRGGWGLYNDEGSTGIVLENNLVMRTKTGGYHLHYGKDLTVRNNIFVDAREGQLQHSRNEPHHQYDFHHNIVWFKTGDLFTGDWVQKSLKLDHNVYWRADGQPFPFGKLDFKAWLAKGIDTDSVVADPLFADPEHGDFTLAPNSPALKLGFKPFDPSRAGVYGDADWVALAKAEVYPLVELCPPPPPPPPLEFTLDFERDQAGAKPAYGQVHTENKGDSVLVSADQAATGKRSLKVTDAPGLQFDFNPHFYWDPNHFAGTTTFSFDVRVAPGAVWYVEWRGEGNPYKTGPSLWCRDGQLLANGRPAKPLCACPPDTWVRIAMSAGVGPQSNGQWDVTITPAGGAPQTFRGLAHGSPDFEVLRWLGFSSMATDKTSFWLDNVELRSTK